MGLKTFFIIGAIAAVVLLVGPLGAIRLLDDIVTRADLLLFGQDGTEDKAKDGQEGQEPSTASNDMHDTDGTDSTESPAGSTDTSINNASNDVTNNENSASNDSTDDNDSTAENMGGSTTEQNGFVKVVTSKFSLEEDYTAMAAFILSPIAGDVDPRTEVARATVEIIFENSGSAVPSVKFDGVLQVDGIDVKQVRTEIGALETGQKVTKRFSYAINISEIPPDVTNNIMRHIIEGKHPVFGFGIKNVEF